LCSRRLCFISILRHWSWVAIVGRAHASCGCNSLPRRTRLDLNRRGNVLAVGPHAAATAVMDDAFGIRPQRDHLLPRLRSTVSAPDDASAARLDAHHASSQDRSFCGGMSAAIRESNGEDSGRRDGVKKSIAVASCPVRRLPSLRIKRGDSEQALGN